MKYFFIFCLLFSQASYGKSFKLRKIAEFDEAIAKLQAKVDILEKRIASLEGAPQKDPGTGLKVMDQGNQTMDTGSASKLTDQSRSISSDQQESIMKTLKQVKENRQKSQNIIDDIMENY